MGKIGLFNSERKKWVRFDKDTEVLLRHVNKEELDGLQVRSKKRSKLTGFDQSDEFNLLFGIKAVLGWRHIKNHEHPGLIHPDTGVPIPFNKDNLEMLMTSVLDFSKFVNDHAIEAQEFMEGCEETKNAS